MTYEEIQQRASLELEVTKSSVKTCWIAEIKREFGLTRGPAPNRGKGRGAPPCPPRYRTVLRSVLREQAG